MKSNKVLLLIILTIVISFLLTFLFYNYYIIQDVQTLGMKAKIGDYVGLDTNQSVISFGTIPSAGGSSERLVTIKNMQDKPLNTDVKTSGEIKDWVIVSENNFVLQADETKELKFTAMPPRDAEKGAYTGQVKFVFTRII